MTAPGQASDPAPDPASAPAAEPAISVRGLTKRFGDKTVVDAVTLDVAAGEIMGFLGPNGSGKTTTIRLMCGLLEPDAGEGRVLGHDIRSDRRAIKRAVGYMTQRFSFYEDLTIAENLRFVAGLYGMASPRRVVSDTLADLGLSSRKDQLAGSLSGGWKQRLALAACIMHRPKLLILDEPTAGVDPKARRDFWDEIHALAQDGLTVLVSTHYMDEAERCHRIAYISYGKLVAQGTTRQVVRDAGLTTLVLSGKGIAQVARDLTGAEGVDQVAPFGQTLHVVGHDGAALRKTVSRVAKAAGVEMAAADTSLEDVFIQLMGESQDNMQ
ncbi:ABC transporter ATP-binding protein [Pseudooceanicola sp.]|uniref:ABC transporter ATP-binding protein n=1 Tax=Pseudooceanicola sp. TaxID=1914328 RepID=UPI00262F7BCC|nr:ABC transporter ATP-binding protein [Pseudooceanicola sp.]MDF1855297.1 ABC transporter ATP-binding protein [Pseudooceanicola sp.]